MKSASFLNAALSAMFIFASAAPLSADISHSVNWGFGVPVPFIRGVNGFGISAGDPSTGFSIPTPYGPLPTAYGLNIPTRLGSLPYGGFGLNPGLGTFFNGLGVTGFVPLQGFGLNGMAPSGASGMAGVQCNFGNELLLASSVDSCETAGGAVAPSQMTYSVRCEINGETVMSGSAAGCARLNGTVATE